MQTSSRLREKFDSAEINRCHQSRIRDCADIGVCEICSGANAEHCRERHGDYECGRFPAVNQTENESQHTESPASKETRRASGFLPTKRVPTAQTATERSQLHTQSRQDWCVTDKRSRCSITTMCA